MNTAEYQRKYRASKGARTGEPGRPVTAPCGTVSAYKRHKRNGEPVDAACRDAYNAVQREYHQRRKAVSLHPKQPEN